MNILHRPRIVLLGMMTKMPVAGVVWQVVHYLVGLSRMGYDVYYVEAHARTPSMFMEKPEDDGSGLAAAFIQRTMRRFDLGDKWAYHALHDDGRVYGLSETVLMRLYREAAVIINLHGGTLPRPEQMATGRLVYLETDPVEVQVALGKNDPATIEYLAQHCAWFTYGENYGLEGCKLPASEKFTFRPTRQPVILDFWRGHGLGPAELFTTVGNWRQHWRQVEMNGQVYNWSKHEEFARFLDLPKRTGQRFELALSSYDPEDKALLERHGWGVRHAMDFSCDIDAYRNYIANSRAEFTVAKDQNIRLVSGWFSDRSATYLAAGRPVITQETGFSRILPTGEGLFGFATLDEAADAVRNINADYARHSKAAAAIAREHFSHEVVLGQLLSDLGLERRLGRARDPMTDQAGRSFALLPLPFPVSMDLEPISRRPFVLPAETLATIEQAPVPTTAAWDGAKVTGWPRVSIIMVTHNHLPITRLGIESLLANTTWPSYELILIDNASTDGTIEYLKHLQATFGFIKVIFNHHNRGFAAANNQGLDAATGDLLILLNNDTIVAPGWLRLAEHLRSHPAIGLLGPVTNRIANSARIQTDYRTYGEVMRFATDRLQAHAGRLTDAPALAMFCMAFRRDIFEKIGPLDEQFGLGMFEDDDYCMRVRQAGFRIACAEDVFVHHFGEASFGELAPSGDFARLHEANRLRFEKKWGVSWMPHALRLNGQYQQMVKQVRQAVATTLPATARVAVASRGDPALLELSVSRAWHFPSVGERGEYAGFHPADAQQAVELLAAQQLAGIEYFLLPASEFWWLEHYAGLRIFLEEQCTRIWKDDSAMIYRLPAERGGQSLSCNRG